MKIKDLFTAFLTVIFLSACGTSAPASPTPDIDAIYTVAAQTVLAEFTQTVAAYASTSEATATETQGVQSITTSPTSASIVETLLPTGTIEASSTDQVCDNAVFVSDISVQDGTEMSPGQSFEKTWLIKNTGFCTWKDGYGPVYGYSEKMGGQARALSATIAPNETAEVTVVFIAPITTGEYQSYWRMANTAGANFGQFFSVKIVVR